MAGAVLGQRNNLQPVIGLQEVEQLSRECGESDNRERVRSRSLCQLYCRDVVALCGSLKLGVEGHRSGDLGQLSACQKGPVSTRPGRGLTQLACQLLQLPHHGRAGQSAHRRARPSAKHCDHLFQYFHLSRTER
jgi:hypothetical protein